MAGTCSDSIATTASTSTAAKARPEGLDAESLAISQPRSKAFATADCEEDHRVDARRAARAPATVALVPPGGRPSPAGTILRTLERHHGNRIATANALGLRRTSLARLIRTLGIP